jgi:hypothetical protein
MWRALVAVTLITAGCSSGPPPPLTLALSGLDSTPLSDGQDVLLEPGAQGGFHVWLSWRAEGMEPAELQLERTARRLSDDKVVLRTSGAVREPGGTLPMFMCPTPIGISVVDQPIVFRLSLADASGARLAAGAITLVPHCPDDGQREFCERICTGG